MKTTQSNDEPFPIATETASIQSLAGPWQVRMDPHGEGIRQKWFTRKFPAETVLLPGTADSLRLGPPATTGTLQGFTAVHGYVGALWFQRDLTISESWRGLPITLFLERCQWETSVWVDGVACGTRNSLVGPHEYDLLPVLVPGDHVLTVRVDNANCKDDPETDGQTREPERLARVSPSMDPVRVAEDVPIRRTDLTTEVKSVAKLNCGGHHLWAHNWVGLLGRLELQAHPPVHISSLDVYPDIHQSAVRLRCRVANPNQVRGTVILTAQVSEKAGMNQMEPGCSHPAQSGQRAGRLQQQPTEWTFDLTAQPEQVYEGTLKLASPIRLWDEFDPGLYELSVALDVQDGAHRARLQQDATHAGVTPLFEREAQAGASIDSRRVVFGLRELGRRGTQFTINGQTTFLRGTLEDFIFPLTGHPPVDVESWRKVISIAKLYGLNLFRLHSCCPPEAAFQAADELGFYFQVELPGTSCPETDEAPGVEEFLTAELKQILRWYGNHPSLLLVSMGNEQLIATGKPDFLKRHQAVLAKKVALGQQTDPRHFYTSTSHPYSAGRIDDYFVSAWPVQGPAGEPLCGIEWGGGRVIDCSRFNTRPPDTVFDYRHGIEGIDRPLITHEVGQWAVYPDLREISRYHGAQRAFNFEIIRQRLADKGLLEWAHDFTRASGMLALALYREEIESARRTPGLAGFMLLDIHDFPGQGTSTVGILNALWESKGLITPEAFRSFNAPCVLLARMARRVWTSAESLVADIELSNYGPGAVQGSARWTIADQHGHLLAQGALPARIMPQGSVTPLGTLTVPLTSVTAATQIVLCVELEGVTINRWEAWVYPEAPASIPAADITFAQGWSPEVEAILRQGGTLLLVLTTATAKQAVPGTFTPVFWNVQMKHHQVAKTMGLLCDSAHPALAGFPTEFHSNWQWWDPIMRGCALPIDHLPAAIRPIVRVIDSFTENRNMALIFEAKVGPGKLLVCATDILTDLESRPVARQLRQSLLTYMAGPLFHPDGEISAAAAAAICKPQNPAHDEPSILSGPGVGS